MSASDSDPPMWPARASVDGADDLDPDSPGDVLEARDVRVAGGHGLGDHVRPCLPFSYDPGTTGGVKMHSSSS